jgi:hypothetical protein
MPIEGLSNKRMIPRLGKFHLGYRHPQKGYPVRTDYFVLPKDHPQYKTLCELFGEQPKELRILIPVEDEEKWSSQYYRCYSGSRGLICKGDGIIATRMVAKGTDRLAWKEAEQVEMKDIKCMGRECPIYQEKKCSEVMNLQFILPEVPGLGVWQIDTGSINSIININSAAELIKSIYKKISMIPLLLTLEPKECNNPETGKKQTVYVMNLRVNMKLSDLAIATRQQAEVLELPIGDNEAPDFAQEFEPIPPDPRTVQENIDLLWPDNPTNKAEIKEVGPAIQNQKEPEKQVSDSIVGPAIEMCTDAQRKKIFADGKRMGYMEADIKKIINLRFKVEHTTDLTKANASELIEAIAAGKNVTDSGEWIP